jgi:hypothetical protein
MVTMGRHLRDADDLIGPALARTLAALGPPDEDAAMVKVAEVIAGILDAMPDGQRGMMAGQTVPQLVKVLEILDERSRRRAKPAAGRPNRLNQLRAARDSGRRPDFL